ncbi:MAG: hypothetical protein U1E87_00990 [Alphaproteobacteria bacterium]
MAKLAAALLAGVLGALALSPALADEPASLTAPPEEAAPSGPSPIEATFANTVRITGQDSVTYVYFNRDGTFISRGEKDDGFGTWKIEDSKICTHTKSGDSCGVVQPDRKVGDKWTHMIGGETFEVAIIAGR